MNELDDETLHLVRFEHDDLEVIVLDLEVPEPSLPELTASEREVALAVADGMSNAEVAEARGVGRTVDLIARGDPEPSAPLDEADEAGGDQR